MAPKVEPKISGQEALAVAGSINPASVSINVLNALLKETPQWHQSKRIWFWADEAGQIIYSVDENLNHGVGDISLAAQQAAPNQASQTVTLPAEQGGTDQSQLNPTNEQTGSVTVGREGQVIAGEAEVTDPVELTVVDPTEPSAT